MFNLHRAVLSGWLSALVLTSQIAHSADFSLSISAIDSQRRPTLSMTGLTTGRYALDASTNLTQWFRLTSAPVTGGPLTFLHADAAQLGVVYYRGQQLLDVAAIVPQVDSNQVAVGLITLEHGGALVLTNASGVRYTFSVGPSNVLETVAVRMQLVTNFTSFPYPNESRTAVLFEPSGFEFYGAGVLEILYPTNIPALKVSSFAFNREGAGFFLTPDVVNTNRIRIPVTHFSGVGSGLWAPTDRTAAATASVENSRDRMSHEIAGILGEERNRQTLGQEPTPDLELATEIETRQQEHYDNDLAPLFVQAETDCALSQFLTREILGMTRESQVLGINSPASVFLASATAKSWACNCLKEAMKACEDGAISDKTLMRTLLGAERQSGLLGGGSALEQCGFGSLGSFMEQAMTKKLPCAPEWFGVMTYTDGGGRNYDCSNGFPGSSCIGNVATALNFQAEVETVELIDDSVPPFFLRQTWTLKLFPSANGTFAGSSFSAQKLPCGANDTTTDRSTGGNSGPLDLEVEFTYENGELSDFNIRTTGDLEVKTTQFVIHAISPCDTGGPGSSSTETFHTPIYLSPEPVLLDEVNFTKRTGVALEGSVSGTRSGLGGISMPFSWTFSLYRNAP